MRDAISSAQFELRPRLPLELNIQSLGKRKRRRRPFGADAALQGLSRLPAPRQAGERLGSAPSTSRNEGHSSRSRLHFRLETDLFSRRFRRRGHQFADSRNDGQGLLIVVADLPLQVRQLRREFLVLCQHLPQLHESPHHIHADLNRAASSAPSRWPGA